VGERDRAAHRRLRGQPDQYQRGLGQEPAAGGEPPVYRRNPVLRGTGGRPPGLWRCDSPSLSWTRRSCPAPEECSTRAAGQLRMTAVLARVDDERRSRSSSAAETPSGATTACTSTMKARTRSSPTPPRSHGSLATVYGLTLRSRRYDRAALGDRAAQRGRRAAETASEAATSADSVARARDALAGARLGGDAGLIARLESALASAWSPTGTWLLNTNYTGRYRRINDTIHATVHIGLTGAPTSAQLAIDLPSGLTCDETKLPFTLNTVGHGINRDGSGIYSSIITLYDTAIDNQIQIYVGQNTSNLLSPVNATNPHAWANNHYLQFTFWVPITEWA